MIDCPDGWVDLYEAAREMRYEPESLRRQVKAGQFTRLRKTSTKKAKIFIPREEVEAFKEGGLDAVARLRSMKAHDIGEAGA